MNNSLLFFCLVFYLPAITHSANPGGATEPTFVYEDAQGNPVLTNKPDTVPGLSQTQEKQPGRTNTGMVPKISLPKLSSQSTLLTLSAIAGVVILAIMMLSQNPALKLLMRWLLVLLVFGTTAKLYFTQGDLQLKAKGSAEQLKQTQQQKDQHLQQLESNPPSP